MTNVLQVLETEVLRFQSWAATVPEASRHGEWECDYPGSWRPLWKAFTDFVTTISCEHWNAATIQMLLYIIARDNDYLHLIGVLAKNPAQLLFFAEQAVNSTEPYARSQIASALGRLQGQRLQVEPLLLRFAHDQDVYVRRCALAALANIGSVQVEALVEPAWATGDVYERTTVLDALNTTNSPQLDHYLLQAEADADEYLRAYAARIRAYAAQIRLARGSPEIIDHPGTDTLTP